MILTTPGLGEFISGVILYDETIRQSRKDGAPFMKVIADAGLFRASRWIREQSLWRVIQAKADGRPGWLRERLTEYVRMGARFAKWRAVIAIADGIPSQACIEANAQALARYAASCQEAGLVPIVEPEVLMDGEHTLEQCALYGKVLHSVFNHLYTHRVRLEEMILKPNMVLSGSPAQSKHQSTRSPTPR